MADRTDDERSSQPNLAVDIDAVALWEPMPQPGSKSAKKVVGLSVESWDFRPARAPSDAPIEIVISQAATAYTLDDGTQTLVSNELEWRVSGTYVETREFHDGDSAPRPKHFFALKVPKGLIQRLRQSPSDILAQSDLYEGEPTKPKT